jgi:hypothetical protein
MELRLTGIREALSLEPEKLLTEVQQEQWTNPFIIKTTLCSESRNIPEDS